MAESDKDILTPESDPTLEVEEKLIQRLEAMIGRPPEVSRTDRESSQGHEYSEVDERVTLLWDDSESRSWQVLEVAMGRRGSEGGAEKLEVQIAKLAAERGSLPSRVSLSFTESHKHAEAEPFFFSVGGSVEYGAIADKVLASLFEGNPDFEGKDLVEIGQVLASTPKSD